MDSQSRSPHRFLTVWTCLAAGAVFLFPNSSEFTPSARRTPSSSPSSAGASACKSFEKRFCGEDAEPDPTGEVLSEEDAELEVQLLIQERPDWISRVYSTERIRRILEVERWVRKRLLGWISQQHSEGYLSLRDRNELLGRIQSTKLEFPDPRRGFPGEPELLLEHGAFFEQGIRGGKSFRRIRLGGPFVLGTSSRFNLAFTLAHELAHSIDPCTLRTSGWTPPALERLSACLLDQGLVELGDQRRECILHDQLSETFADWLATELLAQALEDWGSDYPEPQRWAAVGNSVRDLCEAPDLAGEKNDSAWHPSARVRIERILGGHPRIRQYLGCALVDQKACRLGDR